MAEQKIELSQEQEAALYFNKKHMLVSASAGSGKTTTMVQKIIKYLQNEEKEKPEENKVNATADKETIEAEENKIYKISRLIIITYTRASASDIREKLVKELNSLIREGKNVEKNREHLRDLPFAYIGTIDSVCGQIYRKYFEAIEGASPSLEIMEPEESSALRSLAIKEIFDKRISEGDEDFNELSEIYANAKSFNKLIETVEIFLNFLSAQENPDAFLDGAKIEAEKKFSEAKAVLKEIEEFQEKIRFYKNQLQNLTGSFYASNCADKIKIACQKKTNELTDIFDSLLCSKEDFHEAFMRAKVKESIPNVGLAKKEDDYIKALYATFHTNLKALNERVKNALDGESKIFGKEIQKCEQEDESSRKLVCKLIEIVKDVREKHLELKKKENKCDFEDVERAVLKLFVKNEQIRKEFSASIDHIYLDEYQDTNRLQEAIFQQLARKNLFLVGDLKQAIYGFREAVPELFREKYELYENNEKGENIIFARNYRSQQKILTFVDDVFSKIMSLNFGGVDYDKKSRFGEKGKKEDDSTAPEAEVEVVLFDEPERDTKGPDTNVYAVKTASKKTKEFNAEWYIANKIKSMVGVEEIKDDKGKVRKIRYSDIAVLYRKSTHVSVLMKIFDQAGIPYVAEGMEGKMGSAEVDSINSYLRVIDNYKQDTHLVRALLSPLCGFTEKELADIRKENYSEKYFHQALLAYDGEYKEKVDLFFENLKKYAQLSALVDVPTLVGRIATDTGFISQLLIEGQKAKIAIYNSFIQTLRSKKIGRSLQAYVEFLESGGNMEIPIPTLPGEAVKIMTIHRSKGLEFEVVFVPRAEASLTKREGEKSIVIDSTYGIGLSTCDEETDGLVTRSARRIAIEKAIYRKQNEEALRLMYVALTRARYRLYVVGTKSVDLENGDFKMPKEVESFAEWIAYAYRENKNIPIKQNPEIQKEEKEKEKYTIGEGGAPLTFYEYPYEKSTALSNKYSVTSLTSKKREPMDLGVKDIVFGGLEEVQEELKQPSLDSQNKEIGIAYHKIMELIDFNLTGEQIEEFVAQKEKEGVIEKERVDPKIIRQVLESKLFDKVRAGRCLREQEFIYYVSAEEVLGEEYKGVEDKVLVQGIMDLVVEGEENILIDYKVSSASRKTIRERYKTQIDIYARAYKDMTGKEISKKAILVLNSGKIIYF